MKINEEKLESIFFQTDNWNLVSEKGYPEDGENCFVLWKTETGDIDWFVGGYDENNESFIADYGLGNFCLDRKYVIAWSEFSDIKLKYRNE